MGYSFVSVARLAIGDVHDDVLKFDYAEHGWTDVAISFLFLIFLAVIIMAMMNILVALAVDVRSADLDHVWTKHITQSKRYNLFFSDIRRHTRVRVCWKINMASIAFWKPLFTIHFQRRGYMEISASHLDLESRLHSFKEILQRNNQDKRNTEEEVTEKAETIITGILNIQDQGADIKTELKNDTRNMMIELQKVSSDVQQLRCEVKNEVTAIKEMIAKLSDKL